MKFDNNCLYIKHGANREQQLSFEMSSKTVALLIFAILAIHHAEAQARVWSGPATIVMSNDEVDLNYCEYCENGDNTRCRESLTKCICECSKQGYDWYSYTLDTETRLCTCGGWRSH